MRYTWASATHVGLVRAGNEDSVRPTTDGSREEPVVIAVAVFLRRRWADNAYRRAGLALLSNARTNREANIVLKRVALAVFPRSEAAPLYGDDWAAFLDGTCRKTRFAGLGSIEDEAELSRDLRSLARTWIRHHRAGV